jgi:hypothetical protein
MPARKRYRRPFLVTLMLVVAVLGVLLIVNPNLQEQGKKEVVLRNTEAVDRIILVDSYNSVELTRVNGSWYLFGTEPVNRVSVENLLIAASRLEISSMLRDPPEAGPDEPPGTSREITFFKGGKVLLSYTFRKLSGRYLVHPNGSKTYSYVSLPGYPGLDLDRVFSATPDHYLDHLLIDLLPSEISTIEIELASGEAFRFTQDRKGIIRCEPANEKTHLPEAPPNELSRKLLFSYFTSIRFEQRTAISADSLSGPGYDDQKLAIIRVESFGGEQHTLQVFPYHEIPGSEPDLFRALVLYNDERDAMIVNYIYLDVLMRDLSHYFGEK